MKKKMAPQVDVLVIGGGAAGMMAAGRAAERGKRVLVLEKNTHLGEKLKITGGKRCNITNDEKDVHALLKNYGKAEQFLYSPFSKFGVSNTFSFFEKLGLPLIVQARKRAFPHTEKAIDVYKALLKYMEQGKVQIKTRTKVARINTKGGKIEGVVAGGVVYTADSYILATGGVSHPETGSTGDGFNWLSAIGHTVHKPTPTIVPLAVKEHWVRSLSGTSISFMKITFFLEGKKQFFKKGKVLFTHFGLSGPLILNLAGQVHDLLREGEVTATIDTYPDTDMGALEKKILNVFANNQNKMLKNVFDEIAPRGTGEAILKLLPTIDPLKQTNSVTRDERKQIAHLLKALPLTITGLMGFDRAVVADGGVPLTEIDTKTMRSKKYENLYITGDLLHITRPSGGFSLQLCWTSGYVAGENS